MSLNDDAQVVDVANTEINNKTIIRRTFILSSFDSK